MRLVLRLRTTVTSLSCRPLRDLCYTFVLVAVASALLTYHLSRQLPPSTGRQVVDDAPQRYRRRPGDRPSTDMGAPVDVRQVLEGLDLESDRNPANVDETVWNDHDDDFDNTDNEVGECNDSTTGKFLEIHNTRGSRWRLGDRTEVPSGVQKQSAGRGVSEGSPLDPYLVAPRVRSTRFGSRSFRVCGPTIWNKLSQDLRSTDTREQFKRSLKRWLFECAYTAGDASDRR